MYKFQILSWAEGEGRGVPFNKARLFPSRGWCQFDVPGFEGLWGMFYADCGGIHPPTETQGSVSVQFRSRIKVKV